MPGPWPQGVFRGFARLSQLSVLKERDGVNCPSRLNLHLRSGQLQLLQLFCHCDNLLEEILLGLLGLVFSCSLRERVCPFCGQKESGILLPCPGSAAGRDDLTPEQAWSLGWHPSRDPALLSLPFPLWTGSEWGRSGPGRCWQSWQSQQPQQELWDTADPKPPPCGDPSLQPRPHPSEGRHARGVSGLQGRGNHGSILPKPRLSLLREGQTEARRCRASPRCEPPTALSGRRRCRIRQEERRDGSSSFCPPVPFSLPASVLPRLSQAAPRSPRCPRQELWPQTTAPKAQNCCSPGG